MTTILVSFSALLVSSAVFAQTAADVAERKAPRAKINSSIKIIPVPGGLEAGSSLTVTRGGERSGIESSLGVSSGTDGVRVRSSFNLIGGGEPGGIGSSLVAARDGGDLEVRSAFSASGGKGGIASVGSSLSTKKITEGASNVFRRTSPQVMKKIAQYRRIADEMIAREGDADAWWSGYNLCADLSGKWLPELEKRGMKTVLQATDTANSRSTVILDGREIQAHKFHVFLADNSLGTGENEIIFDATYRQFLEGSDKLSGIPKIFIGTRAEAERLFARFKKSCRVEAGEGGDPMTGRYETKSFTELIYSYGRNAGARQSFERQ